MRGNFISNWLQGTIVVVVLAGLVLATAAHPAMAFPAVWFFDLVL